MLKINTKLALMPHQQPPPGDWRVWEAEGGRGSGKTFTGAFHAVAALEAGKRVLACSRSTHDIVTLMAAVLGVSEIDIHMAAGHSSYGMTEGRLRIERVGRQLMERTRGQDYDLIWCDEPEFSTDVLLGWLWGPMRGEGSRMIVTKPAIPRLARTHGATRANVHLEPAAQRILGSATK